MSTLRKNYRIIVAMWIVIGSVLMIGSAYIGEHILILLLLFTAGVGVYCLTLKCPSCGKPVLHNPVKILGNEVYIWTSWIPKTCTKCGEKL
jgi:hypothetical protein